VPVLRHLLSLLTGAVTGLAAVTVHRELFPAGLVLALAATFAVLWWLRRSPWSHTAASFALGWVVVLGVVLAGRPEGDYLIAADLPGYALLAASLVMVLVGLLAAAGRRQADRGRRS
jgi:Family of unknown function (DUF6113)